MEANPTTLRALGMDSLVRLIERHPEDQEPRQEWRYRYGHDFPVYAVIDGKPVEYKH